MCARRTARSLPRAAGAPPESRAPKTTQLRHSYEQNILISTRGRHAEIPNRKRYQYRAFKKNYSPHIMGLKLPRSCEAMLIRNYLPGNGCRAAAGLRARTHGVCVRVRVCACVCVCVCVCAGVCVRV